MRERSASPECVGGVSTHRKMNSAAGVGHGEVGGELDSLLVGGDELGQARFVDGYPAAAEQLHLVGVDVQRDDVVAEMAMHAAVTSPT